MDARGDVRDNGRRSAPRPCPGAVPRLCEFAVTPTSVDRCIAVAAHGRRCQQTTYRGSPYCWHHTQSRKVPAPSRTRSPQRPPAATAQPARRNQTPLEQVAAALSDDQLRALARFLDHTPDGTFRIEKVDGHVVEARAPHTSPYPRRRMPMAPGVTSAQGRPLR